MSFHIVRGLDAAGALEVWKLKLLTFLAGQSTLRRKETVGMNQTVKVYRQRIRTGGVVATWLRRTEAIPAWADVAVRHGRGPDWCAPGLRIHGW